MSCMSIFSYDRDYDTGSFHDSLRARGNRKPFRDRHSYHRLTLTCEVRMNKPSIIETVRERTRDKSNTGGESNVRNQDHTEGSNLDLIAGALIG